jgi:predicted house-cleaning noncanonical NTP pyrophosphatase (MazG superfamily)
MAKYEKLVRDNIPEMMAKEGKQARTRVADDSEYERMLNQKLAEEVREYQENGEVKELADLVEGVYAILDFKQIRKASFETIRKNKAKARGGFGKRLILEMES